MPNVEIELNPVDFITVGTIGPKGKREFHIQAGKGAQVVTVVIEKEQARRLGEALGEMLDEILQQRKDVLTPDNVDIDRINMELREPIEPLFRTSPTGMGLAYDEKRDLVLFVAQELLLIDSDDDDEDDSDPLVESLRPSQVRFWATRQQMRALSAFALQTVKQGRADPKSNGRILYYWT